jgi:hypothetical protein
MKDSSPGRQSRDMKRRNSNRIPPGLFVSDFPNLLRLACSPGFKGRLHIKWPGDSHFRGNDALCGESEKRRGTHLKYIKECRAASLHSLIHRHSRESGNLPALAF